MPESLWRAVQEETDKQQHKLIDRPMTEDRSPLPDSQDHVEREERTSQTSNITHSVPTSERPNERPAERRPYDFYRDQVLWIKQMKLEIETRYGIRVSQNAIVQLAMDMFISDYERNKERSNLIRELVGNRA